MKDKPSVGIPDLLAAREDALIVEKVSSKKSRAHTQTSLNKVKHQLFNLSIYLTRANTRTHIMNYLSIFRA